MNEVLSFVVHKGELEGRFDPRYYQPYFTKVIQELEDSKWEVKTIRDIIQRIVGGATPKAKSDAYTSSEKGIPFLRIQNITEEGIDLTDVKYITKETHEKALRRSRLRPNDVLFTITGRIGTTTVVPDNFGEGNVNQHMVKITLKEGINPYYVSAFLNSRFGRMQAERKVTGTTRIALDYPSIKSIKIPIPPHKIQDKIAQIMQDAHKDKKQKLQEAEGLLNSINNYVLEKLGIEVQRVEEKRSFVVNYGVLNKRYDVFYYQPKYLELKRALKEGFERNRFKLKKLGDYIKEIKYGASVRNDYVDAEQGIPFLRIQNVTNGELDLTDLKYLNPELKKDLGKCYVKEGDILISRSGTIGLLAYITKEANGFAYGSYMIKFCLSDEINPKFVSILLNTLIGRLQTEQKAIGAVQKNITVPAIRSIEIPVPPHEIQNEIAEEVKKRREKAEKLREEAEDIVKQAKEKVEKIVLSASLD